MAFEIPDHFNQTFTSNVELLLQQQNSVLSDCVTMMPFQGEAAQVVKQFGEVEFQPKNSRHADTVFSEIEHKQRWIYPEDFTLTLPVDKEDELRMLDSPMSPYAMAMRAGWNRRKDETIANAFFGTAQTGTKGTTATTFATEGGGTVAVGAGAAGDTGLNVEKLIQAKELLLAGEVQLDQEEAFIAITSQQLGDLLRSVEPTSSEFSEIRALQKGEVNSFMGFTFKQYERWNSNSNSNTAADRHIPVWVKSGIVCGYWNDLETRIGERSDKEYTNQVFMRGTIGATRTQGAKVVKIVCDET